MSDDLAELLRLRRERAGLMLAAFEAADARTRARVMLVEYRCRIRGCSLLMVWQAAGTRLVWLPRHKLSRRRNEAETVASARAKRTTDGDRHWKPRVLVLDELFPETGLDLRCDHVDDAVSVPDLLVDVDSATPGDPVRRFYPR